MVAEMVDTLSLSLDMEAGTMAVTTLAKVNVNALASDSSPRYWQKP